MLKKDFYKDRYRFLDKYIEKTDNSNKISLLSIYRDK